MSRVAPIAVDQLAAAIGLGDRELVSLVGGGGKTTALFALGRQLPKPVVLTTTTKMGRSRTGGHEPLFDPDDASLATALADRGSALVWRAEAAERAEGVDPERCDRWFNTGWNVVVEADGSRRMPFKAPADY
ncbi:MAG: selenium cofactor biosynthesis protein YqeC [Actinomycetota bacterium]